MMLIKFSLSNAPQISQFFPIRTLTNAEVKLNTTSRLGTSGCQPKRLRRREYDGGSIGDSREEAEGPTMCELPGQCTRQASWDRRPAVSGTHTGLRRQGMTGISKRVVTNELDKCSYVALMRGETCCVQRSQEPREDPDELPGDATQQWLLGRLALKALGMQLHRRALVNHAEGPDFQCPNHKMLVIKLY